jgi:ribosomal protein S21
MKTDEDLEKALRKLSPKSRKALYRVAKARARAFFRSPRAMIILRESLSWPE